VRVKLRRPATVAQGAPPMIYREKLEEWLEGLERLMSPLLCRWSYRATSTDWSDARRAPLPHVKDEHREQDATRFCGVLM